MSPESGTESYPAFARIGLRENPGKNLNQETSLGKVASAERGQIVSIVCCLSPTGVDIPPAIIFPRKRFNPELYRGAPEGTLHLLSDSGFMNTELFVE
ncbi:hypothetical protein ANN_02504 [Periplaneta americana]|uniref:DDE Tnp4 domain-containing protein n=1 Tax=Periplaneta americana TaxID=6978 RepID=A0ABQ8TZE7_PERAM|nr:hypothetical protein ANN_02504 [Periplaneta americana]